MPRLYLRIHLLLLISSAFIFACSQAVVQSQKGISEPPLVPDCQKNDIKEENPTPPQPKQTTIPPENPLGAIRDTTPPDPPSMTTQEPFLELDEFVKEELDKMRGEIETLKKDVSFLKTKAAIPLSPKPKIPSSQAKVIWAHVNLREGPGTDHKVIGTVKKGTPLTILEEKKGWLHVQLEDGTIAWMSKEAISEAPKTPPLTPPPSSKALVPPKPKGPM